MPVSYPCPAGHSSTDSEYCSECGKKLLGAAGAASSGSVAPAASVTAPAGAGGQVCPDCGTRRASPTAVFCEVCRFNFVTGTPWTPGSPTADAPLSPPAGGAVADAASARAVAPQPAVSAAPPDAPPVAVAPASDPAAIAPGDAATLRWELYVAVDPSLYVDPDPAIPCPVGDPVRTFPLDFAENLVGRRSDRRGIYPEIDLSTDHGVSSRHLVLYREANGSLTLLDVGSTNGTQVNGKDIVAGVRTPLQDGDQITLGCWTRMTVRGTPAGASL